MYKHVAKKCWYKKRKNNFMPKHFLPVYFGEFGGQQRQFTTAQTSILWQLILQLRLSASLYATIICLACWRHLKNVSIRYSYLSFSWCGVEWFQKMVVVCVCVCYECCSRKTLQHLVHCSYTISKSLSPPCKGNQQETIKDTSSKTAQLKCLDTWLWAYSALIYP